MTHPLNTPDSSRTVLVAGATGTTGGAVVDELLGRGITVRAFTRARTTADELRRRGVDAAVGSFDDPASLREAMRGVGAAYLVTPSAPDLATAEAAFAAVAADEDVHLVKLSVVGAAIDGPLRYGRVHAESEAAIEALGGSWTFVQPTGFMQNDLAWAAQVPGGVIAAPNMDAAWPIVDVRDIAAVAATALVDPSSHRGRRIVVTGPEVRTPRDRIAALGTLLGRSFTAFDVPFDAAREHLLGSGMSTWAVDGLIELFELYASGVAAHLAPDAASVLGRELRTWERFVEEHLHLFRTT